MLAASLEQTGRIVFGEQLSRSVVREERLPYQYMLSLRLEGRCSLGAIATIMPRFGVECSSTGQISQTLHDIGFVMKSQRILLWRPRLIYITYQKNAGIGN